MQDQPNAMSAQEVSEALALHEIGNSVRSSIGTSNRSLLSSVIETSQFLFSHAQSTGTRFKTQSRMLGPPAPVAPSGQDYRIESQSILMHTQFLLSPLFRPPAPFAPPPFALPPCKLSPHRQLQCKRSLHRPARPPRSAAYNSLVRQQGSSLSSRASL